MVSLTEGTLLFQIINFFILVAILAKFAYKPLLKVLEERRNKIESDLDAAAQAREAAAQLQAEYEAQLRSARAEAQAIIDKAVKQADKEAQAQLSAIREQIARENRSPRRKLQTNGKLLSGKCATK